MIDTGREVRLVLRAQCGDREALEELLRSVQSNLLGYISRLVGVSNAEDVLQDVFLQICRKVKWLREPALFRPWIYRISSRAAFASLKCERRWANRIDDEAIAEELPASHGEPALGLIEEIPALLEEISPASRAVLLLHYIHDLTLEEIAAILEIRAW